MLANNRAIEVVPSECGDSHGHLQAIDLLVTPQPRQQRVVRRRKPGIKTH
jgi:hypothetical protein